MTTVELTKLWTRTLGTPPASEQFEVWLSLHKPEVVERGILKTAMKNLQLGKTMNLDRQVRFASKVMMTKTHDPQKAAGQRFDQPVEKLSTTNTPSSADRGMCE